MSAPETNGSISERGMGYGLRTLGRLAGSETLKRMGARKGLQRAIYHGSRSGFRTATRAGRTFKAARTLAGPARQAPRKPAALFDLNPDEEQQMLCEAVRGYAAEKIRPAAAEADGACATPPELLGEISELGLGTLGIPEDLGGVMHEQAAVTGVLVAEALAHGDMGIACAALAPAAFATAIGRWGSAEQQAAYLPAFTGEHPPAAALAILEPQPLFDPMRLTTTARKDPDGWILSGLKSLVPRAGEAELFIIAAATETIGPALFVVEAGAGGLFTEPEPAMGLRAAATGRLALEGVRVPAAAMLGQGSRAIYSECVHRARIAWCALAAGTAQAVLDHVIPYVNERSAFGEPISNRQAVAFAVSDIAIETAGIRLASLRAASRADEGQSFARESALARELCARHASWVGSEGVQLLGGHGYIKEHPVERWYRDLTAAGVMEGALLL
jgi:alkylation response protein AidB-like acyl-CoA dehydrogenase